MTRALLTTLAAAGIAGLAASLVTDKASGQDRWKTVIAAPNAPHPVGPYSKAIRVSHTVYLSGEIAIEPRANKPMVDASIEDQTRRVLENLRAVLSADGLTMDNIVNTTVYLKDVNDFEKMNAVYATYFGRAPPARATVQVARLPLDMKIEISAIAVHP
jgi:2-iminobutanoate/2-iminopropanoate deaminase